MFVQDLASTNTRYLRSKSAITLSSSKSEQSLCPVNTPIPEVQDRSRVSLNICGCLYETHEATLSAFPDTLLGDPIRRKPYYDERRNEYRFERDPESFSAILFYYQSKGILSKPGNIQRKLFERELEFFGISQHFDRRNEFEKNLSLELEQEPTLPRGDFKKLIWFSIEHPRSSICASIIGILSIGLIIVSVLSFCVETIPELKTQKKIKERNVTEGNSTRTLTEISYGMDHWYKVEITCIAWFSFEYFLRLYSAPARLPFILSPLGLVDLLSIVPFYVALFMRVQQDGGRLVSTLASIRMLRLVRIVRVFKLTRYNEGLKILVMTLYESAVHLRSLLLVILIMAVFFATMVYYTETLSNTRKVPTFESIPDTFWYTIITMTTVGYGDDYPKTIGGKIVGAFCAIFGVLLFCLPSPILVNKFIECYYLRQSVTEKVSPERKAFVESMKELYFSK